jgi:hypothetical protein
MADDIYVTIETQKQLTVDTIGIQGLSATPGNLQDYANVDTANLQNGSVLVYKTTTNKWTSTLDLEDQFMNGGFF